MEYYIKMIPLIIITCVFVLGIIYFEIKSNVEENLKRIGLRLGARVKIRNGFYKDMEGILVEYVPYSTKSISFAGTVFQPEGYMIKLDSFIVENSIFFIADDLEIIL